MKISKVARGSLVVLVGTLGGSFLNYLFHLVMGRLLSPAEYGVLVSLFSLLYIVGVPGAVLGTTAAKFASKYKAKGDFKAVTEALVWTSKVILASGLTLLFLSFLFRCQIAGFLRISNPLLPVLFSVFIVLLILGSVPTGFLQGLLRFKAFSFISFLGPLLKLLLGVGLAALGFGVFGVTWGLILSSILITIITLALLKKNLRFPFLESSFVVSDLLQYALPTTVILLALTSFYNADVVLVKHFFSPEEAGIYSSVVTLGRIIFFGLSSVGVVMFPVASEKYESGRDPSAVFVNSLKLVGLGALLAVVLYSLFPGLLVRILFGEAYIGVVPYLGLFALFMALYSLVNLLVQFFLSIREMRIAGPLCALAAIQALALWFFHGSLLQVIRVNIAVAVFSLVALGFYYLWGKKQLSTINN